jgi:hypothetical protein
MRTTTNGSCGDVAGQETTSEQKQFFTIPRERIDAALSMEPARAMQNLLLEIQLET